MIILYSTNKFSNHTTTMPSKIKIYIYMHNEIKINKNKKVQYEGGKIPDPLPIIHHPKTHFCCSFLLGTSLS